MDCCTSYNEFRHPTGGSMGNNGNSYYPYNQQPGNTRYPSSQLMPPMFRNGAPPGILANNGNSLPLYNEYDRLNYQNPSFNGYTSPLNTNNFNYPHHPPPPPPPPSHLHPNGYYNNYHPYDNYRYSYHHKEPYNLDSIYNNNRNGYPYPYHHSPHHSPHHGLHQSTRDIYNPTQPMFNDIEATPNHPHHNHHLGCYNEYQQSSVTTQFPNGPNNPASQISNATGFPFNHKEQRSRKTSRDKGKHSPKLTANRKSSSVESSISPMTNDAPERCGTPLGGMYPSESYNNFPYGMRMNSNGYPPTPLNWNPPPSQPMLPWIATEKHSPRGSRKISNINNSNGNVSADEQSSSSMPPPSQKSGAISSAEDSKVTTTEAKIAESRPTKRGVKKKKSTNQIHSINNVKEKLNLNNENKVEINKNVTPLPGFQQAFGSTEIGRFSEVFFNVAESPFELNLESEADTLSPQPWETGDSLEGPHFNLQFGASVHPLYMDNYNMDSSSFLNNSNNNNCYFREIRCSDY